MAAKEAARSIASLLACLARAWMPGNSKVVPISCPSIAKYLSLQNHKLQHIYISDGISFDRRGRTRPTALFFETIHCCMWDKWNRKNNKFSKHFFFRFSLSFKKKSDWPFHNLRASRSGDQPILCSQERRTTDFEAPKLWKGRSGNFSSDFFGRECAYRWH